MAERGIRESTVARHDGEQCLGCRYFDHCDPDDTVGCDGYCAFDSLAPDGDRSNEYGGHWTHHDRWCRHFLAGPFCGQPPAPPSEERP